MIQLKRGVNAVININQLSSSAYTKAVMGEEEITLVWQAPAFTQLNIGDYIVYEGANFTLNQLPTVKKLSTRLWQYNAVFQSTKYDLAKAIYMLFDNTGTLPSGEFSLTGTADTFLDLLISNLNRVAGSALWSKGQVLADTEYVDLTFSNEDCLSVLGRLADEFDTEYHVSNRVIHLDKISAAREITLEYGSTIYDIERIAVDSSDIVTRLYPFGSTKNLATNYRGGNSPLRLPEEIGNYIESNVDLYGVIEGSKTFEDIYPRLSSGGAGTVTAVGNEFTFTDTALDFDVNTCLMDGTTAKVHFNTGECAGYDFEIKSYVHATKTFVIIANSMENDLALPTADLKPVVGDKYVLLDIVMPAAYLAAAEAELLAKSQELIAANSTPKVNYKATFSSLYARENLQNVECGDTVTITDDDMGISEPIRIIKLTKAISEYWNVQLDLANAVSKTTLQRITGDVSQLQNNVVTTNERINRSNLLAYRNNKELREMIFDPEGYFDPENIKPLSIETSMLSVGSKSQSLQLSCILQPNYTGNAQILQCSAGVLAHFTIDETQIKEWVIGAGIITITGGNQTAALYIYARCARSGSTGDIYLSPTAIKFDSDATNWMFLIGVLHSPASGVRGISLTYGMTTVNGQFIKTGVISSADGATWFNLNTGEIAGNIKFKSGETYKEVGNAIQTAVNEVTVGGRNLIINSNMETTSSDYNICIYHFGNEKPVAGEYMLSLKGELTDAQQTGFYINVDDNSGSYPVIAVFGNNDKGIDGIYRKKVTIPAMQNPITFGVAYAYPLGLGKQATMHWMKLEKGNKATDWTPAPEDVQAGIDNAQNTANSANQSVTTLNDYVDGAFKDGVVSQAEAKAIEKYLNSVSTEYDKAISSYEVVYANSYLEGTPKATLLNSKITLAGTKDALVFSINTAILDGKTTAAEKTDVDAKYTSYKSAFATYSTALENANKAIQQKLDSLGTDKVNNIVIGGKNLVRNSATAQGGSTSFFAFNAPGGLDSGMSPIFDENGVGIYAFSFDIRTDVAGEVLFYPMPGDAVSFRYVWDAESFNTTTNWQRIKLIRNVTLNNPDAPITALAFYGYNVPGVFPQIRNFKIEKGNKATDWTPAPEDVQSDINAALAKAAEADYLKAALTGSTDIAGGLVGTNVILLKTLAGLITGGMSGLADDNIGFWTGGTYADAIANLANIILRKDGSGQLAGGNIKWNASGSLLEVVGRILAQSGKIGGLDIFADTLKSNSMSFTENPVETLAALLSPLTVSIGNQSSWINSQTNAEAHAYTQALAVTVDSQIKFKATATPDPTLNDRSWLVYINDSSGNRVFSQSGSGSISNQLFTVNVPAGTYTIHATAGGLMNLGQTYNNSASITGETSSTIIATGYSYQTKIGNNGFYSFWNVLQYLYYSSAQGLKVRGAVDMPAGLGGASISAAGGISANWGKIDSTGKVVKSGSNYTITHNIGDTNYSLILTPISANVPYFSSRAANTVVVTCAGGFDFILVRTQ